MPIVASKEDRKVGSILESQQRRNLGTSWRNVILTLITGSLLNSRAEYQKWWQKNLHKTDLLNHFAKERQRDADVIWIHGDLLYYLFSILDAAQAANLSSKCRPSSYYEYLGAG